MQAINPFDESFLWEINEQTFSESLGKINNLRKSITMWSSLSLENRSKSLLNLAQILKKNSKTYAETISLEMGKPISQAIAEIEKSASVCEYYSKHAFEFLNEEKISPQSKVVFEPLGVIYGIMPWNFPFWQVFRFAASALIAGNVIAVKHASNVPKCAQYIEEAFIEADFPTLVYQNIQLPSSNASELIPYCDAVSFTGSTEAGKKIAEISGKNIKKCVLELGGNDPFLVFSDADISKAAETAVTARFQNCGQSCIAAKRFILHKSISDEFIEQFIENTNKLVLGNPLDQKTTLGPLARKDLHQSIEKQLKASLKEGSKVLYGGKNPFEKGYFYEPTIVLSDSNSILNKEETFGPLASIYVFDDPLNMIDFANSTNFGLASSVWTSDSDFGNEVAMKLKSGYVAINLMARSDLTLPFGGIKDSGYGRELGSYGIKEFVNIKSIKN